MKRSDGMHVLLVPSWYPANETDVAGSFFREQARALRDAGMKVGVIAPRSLSLREPSRWRSADRAIHAIDDDGVFTIRSTAVEWFGRVPWLGPRIWIERGMKLYRHYLSEHGAPDVVHAHSLLNGGLLAHAIAKDGGIPYVVTEHRTAYARGLVPSWKLAIAEEAAHSAFARIAVSEPFVALLDELLDGVTAPWTYVPNPVAARFFAGQMGRVPAPDEGFQFCNVGLMTPKKGQLVLIRAFAEAFRDSPEVSLTVAGDGPLRRELEALAVKCGVADRVRFAGRLDRDQVANLLRESSAFVLSSEVETFGVVVAEALAMGLPVVATRSGGPESIVRESDGLLVQNNDHAALVHAMRQIRERRADYRPERLRMGCAARYSGQAVAGRLLEIYRAAVGARDSR